MLNLGNFLWDLTFCVVIGIRRLLMIQNMYLLCLMKKVMMIALQSLNGVSLPLLILILSLSLLPER